MNTQRTLFHALCALTIVAIGSAMVGCGASESSSGGGDDDANNIANNDTANNDSSNNSANNDSNNEWYGDNGANNANNGANNDDGIVDEPVDAEPRGGFVDASEDNLETFSIDVDTASYTLMRSMVEDGQLPRESQVRVEEYINYFDYDYDAPEPGSPEPFSISLEAAPSRFGDNLQLLRVGIQGEKVPQSERKPANLIFLVDVSGSMSAPDKIGLVRHSLYTLLDELGGDDTIGIVTYAGADTVLLPPTSVSERDEIVRAIERLSTGGGTNGAAGITTAYDLAESVFVEDGINRIVLCTDGDFNVGRTGESLVQLVESWRDRGIFLSVLGFGRGFNDAFLEDLTNRGDGNYAFIDNAREAERAVGFKLTGTIQTIAKDVKIQVEFNPEVVSRYRLIGYENRAIADEDFDNDDVDAGEIGSGHSVTAYLELEMAEGAQLGSGEQDIASVHVRYKKPVGGSSEEIVRGIAEMEAHPSFDEASDGFRFGAAVAEYGEILARNPNSVGAEFEEIALIAESAEALETEEHGEFVELVRMAGELWR